MERKGIGLIFLSLCLALAMLLMPEPVQGQNCDKNPDHPKCGGGGGDGGGDSDRLTVWFRDWTDDNLKSDVGGGSLTEFNCGGDPFPCYVDGEQKVKAFIDDGPPGAIRLELDKSRRGITLDLTECQGVPPNSCDDIPDELNGVVQPWHVTARAYADSQSPQLIPVGDSTTYRLRVMVRTGGKRWLIEFGSTAPQPPGNQLNGTRCLEQGEDVTVTGLADTGEKGSTYKWLVTAEPPVGSYNARLCTVKVNGSVDLVARLRMRLQYTAQLK